MFLFKSDIVSFSELPAALACLPDGLTGLPTAATLTLWQQWHRQGTLQIGRVDRVLADGARQTQALGITAWITDAAVAALSAPGAQSCTQRLYAAASQGRPWLMTAADIQQAHDANALNLMVLHFWSGGDVNSPDFQPVFLQAHMLFRDLHQGFGVQALFQEVPAMQAPFLSAAGMQVIHAAAPANA
ncbi:MAG: hypothetical protein EOO54_28630, partial [Haliea sp.]